MRIIVIKLPAFISRLIMRLRSGYEPVIDSSPAA